MCVPLFQQPLLGRHSEYFFKFTVKAAFTHIGEGDEIIYIAYFKIIANDKIFER